MMARSGLFGLILGLAVYASAYAQAPAGGRSAITITPVTGYSLGYEKSVRVQGLPGAVGRWDIAGKAVVGLNFALGLGERFEAVAGVLYRGEPTTQVECGQEGAIQICTGGPREAALWIARAGVSVRL